MWEKYRERGVAVVGVNAVDTPERIEDFAGKYGLTYLQLVDPKGAYSARISSTGVIPRTLVLDGRQTIVHRELGYTEEKMRLVVAAVDALLSERTPPE